MIVGQPTVSINQSYISTGDSFLLSCESSAPGQGKTLSLYFDYVSYIFNCTWYPEAHDDFTFVQDECSATSSQLSVVLTSTNMKPVAGWLCQQTSWPKWAILNVQKYGKASLILHKKSLPLSSIDVTTYATVTKYERIYA